MGTKFGIATESSGVIDVAPDDTGLFKNVILIREGWGQSGYYPGDVLHEQGPKVFREGLRMFLNHADGPVERADSTIGTLASDARPDVVDGRKVLRGDIRIFKTGTHNVEWVKERAKAKAIELSIRSGVEYGTGEREGRFGKVVTAFTEAYSLDVVARGGAGGSFGTIEESAQIGQAASESQEGDDVPITAEEAQAIGAAVAAALAPQFQAVTTGLGDLKTAQEHKVTATPLTAREINEKITAAKLGDKAVGRVYGVIEEAGKVEGTVIDGPLVDQAIKKEADLAETIANEAKAMAEAAGVVFEEAGKTGDQGGTGGGYTPGAVTAWSSKKGDS